MLIILLMAISAVATGVGIVVTNITSSGVAGLIAGIISWVACIGLVSE